MYRVEVSIEVGPIEPDAVARLKSAGFTVYRGQTSWRVVAVHQLLARDSVRAQAHVLAAGIVRDFGLEALSDPPAIGLRDPDAEMDAWLGGLMLHDNRRAYDPDPLTRPPRKLYQKVMELGLGERKGD